MMEMKEKNPEKILTLPNILTLLRAGLVPLLIIMVLRKQSFGALFVFFLAGLTDALDGFTARVCHLRTRFGTLIDPIADKLLLSTAFLLLAFRDMGLHIMIPVWLTVVVVSRDLIVFMGSVVIYLWKGEKDFPPSLYGKISTILQVGTVFLVLLANYVRSSSWIRIPLLSSLTSRSSLLTFFWLTLASTAISGTHYILKGIRLAFFRVRKG
jgi:cardiolipin synthase